MDIGFRIFVSLALSEDFGSVPLCYKFEATFDEFASFFQCLATRTLSLVTEKCMESLNAI